MARQLTENKIDFVGTDIDVDITNPQAFADFAKKLNEDGPRNIANLANQIHAKMIHISTDYVFDGSGSSPDTEDMPIAPIGVYGKTKAAG